MDYAGQHHEEQIRLAAIVDARAGSNLVVRDRRDRLRIERLREEKPAGTKIIDVISDTVVRFVQRQATAVAEFFIVQHRPASRVTGGEEGRLGRLVANRRVLDTFAIAIGVASVCEVYSANNKIDTYTLKSLSQKTNRNIARKKKNNDKQI